MFDLKFHEAVQLAVAKDPRYQPLAYEFVRDALHVAVKHFREGEEDPHVTGQQVLLGVKMHALAEYGPLALMLLHQWGIHRGEDIGNIVYNFIEIGYFGKNDGDSIEDFANGFDFEKELTSPFQPSSKQTAA